MLPIILGLGLPIVLFLLSACTPIAEAWLIGTSETMRAELRNGAIVRAEMRARGETPF